MVEITYIGDFLFVEVVVFVECDKGEASAKTFVCEGEAEVGCDGGWGVDAWNDLHRDIVGSEVVDLWTGSAEYRRISSL